MCCTVDILLFVVLFVVLGHCALFSDVLVSFVIIIDIVHDQQLTPLGIADVMLSVGV